MQIEAIYNNGFIKLPENIHLSSEVFKIRIDIPASVIRKSKAKNDKPDKITHETFNIRNQIDQILGSNRGKKSGKLSSTVNYKQIWHEHLEEKYIDSK